MQRPERHPPFVLNDPENIVAHPHLDFDWTLTVNNDKDLEHRHREIRNHIQGYIAECKNVVYRST
eukprot:853550-Karenia_brevis.AAC.1